MYRAKRTAPAILTEPFDKTAGGFRQERSLSLIFHTSLNSALNHFTETGCLVVLAQRNLQFLPLLTRTTLAVPELSSLNCTHVNYIKSGSFFPEDTSRYHSACRQKAFYSQIEYTLFAGRKYSHCKGSEFWNHASGKTHYKLAVF